MLDLDGSSGGGQLVRSALTCSLLTGEPFQISGIRGERPTPGLKPQHVAAVELATGIADATVKGNEIGNEALRFEPTDLSAGEYEVDIRTAGSVSLLCDVVLPLTPRLDEPLTVTVSGGTDVAWSPPADFLRAVKLPLLHRAGWNADIDIERRGFYPVGGGQVTLSLSPSTPDPLSLTDRGAPVGATAFAVESSHISGAEVADRMAETVGARLEECTVDIQTETVESDSPGAVVVIRLDYEQGVAGVSALGEKGVPAEDVATQAVKAARAFDAGPGAVDSHLADQLVVPIAVSGGQVRIPAITSHIETNVELVRAFGFDVDLEDRNDEPGARLSAPGI